MILAGPLRGLQPLVTLAPGPFDVPAEGIEGGGRHRVPDDDVAVADPVAEQLGVGRKDAFRHQPAVDLLEGVETIGPQPTEGTPVRSAWLARRLDPAVFHQSRCRLLGARPGRVPTSMKRFVAVAGYRVVGRPVT